MRVWLRINSMFGRNEARKIHKKGARKINKISKMIKNLKMDIKEIEEFMIYFERSLKVSFAVINCFLFEIINIRENKIRISKKIIAPAEAFEILYP